MSELLERVDSLQNTLSKVLHRHQVVNQKYKVLQQEHDALATEKEALLGQLEILDAKFSSLKTANAMLGSKEFKTETKLKINTLIKEIDSCIAHLAE